jgi:membrane dipeptidase
MTSDNKGFHPILEKDHPYIFVDTCVQIWPDADFPNAHRHGVTVYGVTALLPHRSLAETLESLMFFHLIARRNPNMLIVQRIEDIYRAKRDNQAALLLAAQDGDFIGNKLHRIEAFYRLGLRMMLPAYNATNLICDGCLDRTNSGLTRFGELVVDECNRVGLLLDCTHIGQRASLDIIECSDSPVVFSHSNPKAVVDNARNIDDQQIKACAAKGGVIGLCSWGPLNFKKGSTQRPTIDDFVDNFDYVAQLLGSTDNIGIGTDNSLGTYLAQEPDPWGEPNYFKEVVEEFNRYVAEDSRSPLRSVNGFSNYPEIMTLIDKLQQRGFNDQDVRKILGENYLRVFKQVWK